MNPEHVAELVEHRLEQARAAIEDAQFLLDGKRTPVAIINRAYYAMFYAALALLQTIGKTPTRHTGVISLFDTEFMLKGIFSRELSRSLHDAFDARLVSDYQPVRSATPVEAAALLLRARRFVAEVERFLATRREG